MMTFSAASVGIGLAGGLILGGMYFGGLWGSVRKARKVKHKKLLFLVSWAIRSALLCYGLYVLARYNIVSLLCATAGLLIARSFVMWRVKKKTEKKEKKKGDKTDA